MAHREGLLRIRQLLDELRREIDALENDEAPEPLPANVIPLKGDEQQLTGVIGRPVFRQPNGRSLWTAGLGVSNGTGGTVWHNVQCWGTLAEYAAHTST